MKILLDEDVYAVTGRFLKSLNHDVANVYDLGLSELSDEVILRTAMERQAVLITRDKDFGHLVFVKMHWFGRHLSPCAPIHHRFRA